MPNKMQDASNLNKNEKINVMFELVRRIVHVYDLIAIYSDFTEVYYIK